MAAPDLAALIAQAQESKNRVRCATCKALSDMPVDDARILSEALSDPDVSAVVISKALAGYGITISSSAITRHCRECR